MSDRAAALASDDSVNVRRPMAATAVIFLANGLLFASWTAHIPQVKAHLGLTDATLGLALLGAPAGSVSAILASARLLPRVGSKRLVQATLIGYCVSGPLVGRTGSVAALFAALFAWGAFQAALDVAMNTQAVVVERARGRPLMSGLHAWWSIGSFAGAGLGVLGVAIGLSLTDQLLLLGLPALVIPGWLTTWMLPDATADIGPNTGPNSGLNTSPDPVRRRGGRLSGTIIVLGAIAFASFLCEGASADWAAVYLRGSLSAGAAIAGLGYTAFSLAMVTTRLTGNRLLARFGTGRLLSVLAAVATVGFTAGLLGGRVATALVGFGCLGLGLALVVPSVFSAAGRLPGLDPGTAIATASAFGWAGLVCGPPLIGALASVTSLPTALGLIPVLTALIAVATARAAALRQDQPGRRVAGSDGTDR